MKIYGKAFRAEIDHAIHSGHIVGRLSFVYSQNDCEAKHLFFGMLFDEWENAGFFSPGKEKRLDSIPDSVDNSNDFCRKFGNLIVGVAHRDLDVLNF